MQRPLLTLPAPVSRKCCDCGAKCLPKRGKHRDSFCVVEMHSGDALCECCYAKRPPRRLTVAGLSQAIEALTSSRRYLGVLLTCSEEKGAQEWREEIADEALTLFSIADDLEFASTNTCVVCGCCEITDSTAEDERHFVAEELCEFCIGRRDFEGRLCGQCDSCNAYVLGLIVRPGEQWSNCLACFNEDERLRAERRAA